MKKSLITVIYTILISTQVHAASTLVEQEFRKSACKKFMVRADNTYNTCIEKTPLNLLINSLDETQREESIKNVCTSLYGSNSFAASTCNTFQLSDFFTEEDLDSGKIQEQTPIEVSSERDECQKFVTRADNSYVECLNAKGGQIVKPWLAN